MGFVKPRFELSISYILHILYRLIQLILALTVCALYGININHDEFLKNKLIFAEITAGLSAVTAILYFIPYTTRIPFVFIWDVILFLLWIALFGIFGQIYMKKDTHGDSWDQRMKNTVWIDLANAICWLVSAIGLFVYWNFRKRRSLYTGRATV